MQFPGMNPYLENPSLWPGVHASMIVYIRDFLQPQLRPRYVAAVEERVYLEDAGPQRISDVWVQKRGPGKRRGGLALLEADTPVVVKAPGLEIHETYVTILDRYAANQVVTVIELVSPANKEDGPGRDSYLEKQAQVRRSKANLVEIDLLRAGRHVVACTERLAKDQGDYHYQVCVNRAKGVRDLFDLYLGRLRLPLPKVRIPLAQTDADVMLDLQAVLEQTYELGGYEDRIDYQKPCQPSLSQKDQTWANQRFKAKPSGVIRIKKGPR